jgi:predicted membrane-bound dolichyl-phosphate-mannose-protein mannosyltransferase
MTIGNIASVSVADKPLDNAIVWFIGASLFPIFLVAAGRRLWRGEGWIWGSLASLLVALDLALFTPEPRSINAVVAVVVKVALLTAMANGTRGALALRKVDYQAQSAD